MNEESGSTEGTGGESEEIPGDPHVRDGAGPLADGEPEFTAPWQARAFGLVVASVRRDETFDWEAFQSRLIEAVDASKERDGDTHIQEEYYEQWLEAFETLLVDDGVVTPAEIEARSAEFSAGDRTAEEFVEGTREPDH